MLIRLDRTGKSVVTGFAVIGTFRPTTIGVSSILIVVRFIPKNVGTPKDVIDERIRTAAQILEIEPLLNTATTSTTWRRDDVGRC